MSIEQLDERHSEAMIECLEADVAQNLFLLSLLEAGPVPQAQWYGHVLGDRVTSVVMVLPDRLAVPWAPDPTCAEELGHYAADRHPPCMMVGPREAVDTMWGYWGRNATAQCFFDQRLYVCDKAPQSSDPGLRLARKEEWPTIADRAAAMEREDLGRDPQLEDPALHDRVVQDRIELGKTMVIDEGGELIFQLNLGSSCHYGCQVGGTWVPPHLRGRGIATRGMRACLHHLLKSHAVVTLHVNEANTPAVRCYERSGFVRSAAFRLLTLET